MKRTISNRLIQSLAARSNKSFLTDLRAAELNAHHRLSDAGNRLKTVYFPIGAVISTLCESDGRTVEVHGVGREGMLGSSVLFAAEHLRFDLVCQIGGTTLSMPSSTFHRHLRDNAALQQAILQYSMSTMTFLTQSVACNGLHSIAQRCARWLLITGDRVGALEFSLTHELLARMLGVRRPGVSIAVQRLARIDAIRYRFGHVTIIDRERLELESCECYGLVVRETRRITARVKERAELT